MALIARNAGSVLAAGVFVGLAAPPVAETLRPALAASVWLLIVLSAMRINWADAAHASRRPAHVVAIVALLLIAAPAVAAALAWALDLDDGLALALVLMAGAPPIMSSPALALLLGLDAAYALVLMLAATLATPLVLPAVMLGLLGLDLDLAAGALLLRLGLFVTTALVAGLVARALLGQARVVVAAPAIDGCAVVLLVVFAMAIMDGVTAKAIAEPVQVVAFVTAAFAANMALQGVAACACAALGRRRALTVGFVAGNRNMALLFAVLPDTSDPAVFLYFAVAQLPIYLLPIGLSPVYRRLLAPR